MSSQATSLKSIRTMVFQGCIQQTETTLEAFPFARSEQALPSADAGGDRIAVRLDRASMNVAGRSVPLQLSMAAQADSVTETGRIITFLIKIIANFLKEKRHETE
ncbi:hypothetical protein [Methylobacterium oryzisoli]|uniref:hypothetical protein n=1 Tax=Methylobacterium oryzisoli TaxID=3385502 RepID=UPI0038921E29